MSDDLLNSIKKQFNSSKRVDEMLVSYGLTEKNGVARDVFEALREEMVIRTIAELREQFLGPEPLRLLDVGCGIGGLVLNCLRNGIDAHGVDCADEMVRISRERLQQNGFMAENIQPADFLQYHPGRLFDLVTAIGVIWYYDKKSDFLKKVYECLSPGGYACVVHRNGLFNLSAFNQGTLDFFQQQVLEHLPEDIRQEIIDRLVTALPDISEPIIKKTSAALAKAYDNPLTISDLYQEAGLKISQIRYTYIHTGPPRLNLEADDSVLSQIQRDCERAWQGMFLGSQFMVVAHKE